MFTKIKTNTHIYLPYTKVITVNFVHIHVVIVLFSDGNIWNGRRCLVFLLLCLVFREETLHMWYNVVP